MAPVLYFSPIPQDLLGIGDHFATARDASPNRAIRERQLMTTRKRRVAPRRKASTRVPKDVNRALLNGSHVSSKAFPDLEHDLIEFDRVIPVTDVLHALDSKKSCQLDVLVQEINTPSVDKMSIMTGDSSTVAIDTLTTTSIADDSETYHQESAFPAISSDLFTDKSQYDIVESFEETSFKGGISSRSCHM